MFIKSRKFWFDSIAFYVSEIILSPLNSLSLLLSQNLDRTYVSVCNDVIWSVSEIPVQVDSKIQSFVLIIFELLILIINRNHTPKVLFENKAITIRRLGLAYS